MTKYPLNQIYFYLTEGCNLRCRHCWIAPVYQTSEKSYPTLDIELFRSIIAQGKALGLGGVKLTGGEPLLHPHFSELLDIIRQENLRVTVETNGVLCTEEVAQEIARCKRSFVSVSLDGADAATHEWVRGVEGSYEAALNGVRNLVRVGFKPQIIMSVMRRNKDQMEQVVQLAKELGAGSVKFNIVQPTARGEQMHERQESLSIEELLEIGRWAEIDLPRSAGLRTIFHHPPAFRPLSRMFGQNNDGCSICGILGILGVLADGSYALCGIGETVSELVFGHAARDRLEEVWNETPILQELRAGLPQRLTGVCGECLLKGRCLGSCIAQNYYSNKDLWAPFWYCQGAKDKGLFPESRLRPG
jgi:SynChlorMet cassette radical SAM/SPASM protein ScmF